MSCFVARFVISLLARPKVFIDVLAWGVYGPTAMGTGFHFFIGSSTQLERSPDPIFCVGPACFRTVVVMVTHTPSLGALPLSVVFLSSFLFFWWQGGEQTASMHLLPISSTSCLVLPLNHLACFACFSLNRLLDSVYFLEASKSPKIQVFF